MAQVHTFSSDNGRYVRLVFGGIGLLRTHRSGISTGSSNASEADFRNMHRDYINGLPPDSLMLGSIDAPEEIPIGTTCIAHAIKAPLDPDIISLWTKPATVHR